MIKTFLFICLDLSVSKIVLLLIFVLILLVKNFNFLFINQRISIISNFSKFKNENFNLKMKIQ